MQISELLRLTEWFKKNIVKRKIPNYYSDLFKIMNQNTSNSKQPFENEKNELFESLTEVNINSLTLEQIKFLEQIEILDLLGSEGISNIESILYKNKLDIATAANKVGEFNSRVQNAVKKINELDTVLGKSFSIDDGELPEDTIMMRVYFQDSVAINDITDFKKLSTVWYDIGRGIAMAQGFTPEDFKIVGAQKGSLIIEMAVLASIATSVSTILLKGLKIAERVIDILKKAEELKAMKLSNENIEKEVKKAAKLEKEKGINLILELVIEELGLNKQTEGDKVNALEKSITKLINFTQKGGAVDFIEPNEEEINESEDVNESNSSVRSEIKKLKNNVEEIRQLENKIKLLENKIDS
ncbi:hypothetical protein [Psychroflexus aestuariivivens]|uniref:hypothetical protein n=1 Tax=Psychroflexus aestuariivivens TaxID=1795040 RepID=UPI000FD928FB|nr:hypothetical protein [Psychroflexus aestuariivivens]